MYCITHTIEMLVPKTHECAYFSRLGYVTVSEYLFKAGMHLLQRPFFRDMLSNFMLASTQVLPNGWSQLVGLLFLVEGSIFGR